jgi:hypothetical protein
MAPPLATNRRNPQNHEACDSCIADSLLHDPRERSLLQALQSPAFRRVIGDFPGYDSSQMGECSASESSLVNCAV